VTAAAKARGISVFREITSTSVPPQNELKTCRSVESVASAAFVLRCYVAIAEYSEAASTPQPVSIPQLLLER
jgi:hypothetical protein